MHQTHMLSIKKFARFTGISESTLRFYDKIKLFSPMIRGENNYRYYTPMQAITVNYIKVLIQLGVPLSSIKRMHKSRTPQDILNLLIKQERNLDEQLYNLQVLYSIIHTYRDNIQNGISADENVISVQELDEIHLTLGKYNNFIGSESFYAPFMAFCDTAQELNINLNYPIGGYYEDMSAFLNEPAQPSRFFSQDPRGNTVRRAGQYLVAYCRGYYGEHGDIPQKMFFYAQENGFEFSGPVFVTYLLDEVSMTKSDQYLSQTVVGVTKD